MLMVLMVLMMLMKHHDRLVTKLLTFLLFFAMSHYLSYPYVGGVSSFAFACRISLWRHVV